MRSEYSLLIAAEDMLQVRQGGTSMTLSVDIAFTGGVSNFSISEINDQRKLTLELVTGNSLMDEKRHFRSYQIRRWGFLCEL